MHVTTILSVSSVLISSVALVQGRPVRESSSSVNVPYWDRVAAAKAWSLVEQPRDKLLACPNNGAAFGFKCRDADCTDISMHCVDLVKMYGDSVELKSEACGAKGSDKGKGTVVTMLSDGKSFCRRTIWNKEPGSFSQSCMNKTVTHESVGNGYQGEAKCPEFYAVTGVTMQPKGINFQCCRGNAEKSLPSEQGNDVNIQLFTVERSSDTTEAATTESENAPAPDSEDKPKEDKPKEDTTEDKPKEDTTEDKPKEDTTEKPKEDTTEDKPKEDTTEDKPKEDTTEDKPKEDTTEDKPKEDTKPKDQAENPDSKDKPKSDTTEDKLKSDKSPSTLQFAQWSTFVSASSSCGIPVDFGAPNSSIAALSKSEFVDSTGSTYMTPMCNQCVKVTGPEGANITAKIVSMSNEPAGSLQLNKEAYEAIAPGFPDGNAPVSYVIVAC